MAIGDCISGGVSVGPINVTTQEGIVQHLSRQELVLENASTYSDWFNILDFSSIRVTVGNLNDTPSDAVLEVTMQFTGDDNGAADIGDNPPTVLPIIQDDDIYRVDIQQFKTFNFNCADEWARLCITAKEDFCFVYAKVITRRLEEKPSTHKINETLDDDTDADLVKAIVTAKKLGDGLIPTGTYENLEQLPFGGLRVGDVSANLVEEQDLAIPTGAAVTINSTLNTESNVFDSGWIHVNGFHSQLAHIKGDTSVKVYLMNAADSDGTNFTGGDAPFTTTINGFPSTGGAMFPQDYFRMVVVNDSGAAFLGDVQSKAFHQPLGSIITALDAPVFDFFTAPLTQNVIKGKNEDTDIYENVQLSKDNALFVANANRLSEVKDRTHVEATGTLEQLLLGADLTLYTVTSGRRFQMTSLELTVTNTITTGSIVEVRDGGVLGTIKRNYVVAPGTNQTKQALAVFITYDEPIPYDTDVTIVIPPVGSGIAAINITGYDEPI